MGTLYEELKPSVSEIAIKNNIPTSLTEFGTIERVYSNFTALVVTLGGRSFVDGVLIPSNLGAIKGSKIKGRLPTIQKGQMVLMQYFDDKRMSGAIISIYPHTYNNSEEMRKFFDTIEEDKIEYTEEFVDFQEEFRITYKKDRYFIYDISQKKEIYSFQVKDKQFYFGDLESSSSNEKVIIEISKDEKLGVGKADMSAVSLDELKTWMDNVKKYMDDVKTWMDDTKDNIKGIMDSLKNGTTVPTDGGSSYKASITTSLANIKQPDSVEIPNFPEKTKLGDTNLKISKKGS
jgi:hypothetical protein